MSGARKEMRTPPPMGRGPWGPGPAMGMPVQKAKDFSGTLYRLLGYFKPHTYRLLIVMIAAVFSTVFSIISPKIMGQATTKLADGVAAKLKGLPLAGVDLHAIFHFVINLAGLYIFSSLFSYVQQYVMAGVAQRTVYDLRTQVNGKLSRLPLSFFDSRPHGEILSRFVNDFDNIGTTLQQSLTQFITAVMTFVGVIVMMLSISPLMTGVVVLTLPISFVVTKMIAKRSQTFFVGQQKTLGELNAHVEEMYTGHRIVKAFGHEKRSLARFDEINQRLYDAGWKAQFISGIIMPLMNFLGNVGFVLVSVIGGILVIHGRIKIGDVLAFIQYARQFSQPITQISSIANVIQSTVASAERVFELLDEDEEVADAIDAQTISSPNGKVEFQQVEFGYQSDSLLIHSMNIHVRAGQTVAIVGPTGAGKTTLVNLLMRFYELNGGKILIDGIDTRQLKRSNLRNLFGMVLQETWLFHGTIQDNIGYGREDATSEEILGAAKAAHVDHFIRTLPDGYATIVNEEASNISQGQKQLLTIARAILSDPTILILDEATSSVDTRTEVLIQSAMRELMQGRTTFVIAHRLSTIREADWILVMDRGTVVEQGTHEELLTLGSVYADLYNSQFSRRTPQNSVV